MLDVNSGAVHIIDELTFDALDDFDGTNGKFNRILDATLENINSTVIYPAVQEGD